MTDRPRSAAAPVSPSVTVVICAYTDARWASLVEAVSGSLEQTLAPDEVIVVIDHNEDLVVRAREAFPAARVLENASRQGLSGARNTGFEAAAGDLVAFLDDDAVPAPNWLESLVQPLQDERVVGAGGSAEPSWHEGTRPAWFPREFDWVVGCSYKGLPTTAEPVRNPIGCSMLFRREALVAAGGFALTLGRVGKVPLGCEETELAIRIARLDPGASVIYVPDAAVRHDVSPDRMTWKYFRRRCYAEGLSKAAVVALGGAQTGLSSERAYVSKVLPLGVLNGLRDVMSGDRDGVRRAAAIIAGVGFTGAGYVRARLVGSSDEPLHGARPSRATSSV